MTRIVGEPLRGKSAAVSSTGYNQVGDGIVMLVNERGRGNGESDPRYAVMDSENRDL